MILSLEDAPSTAGASQATWDDLLNLLRRSDLPVDDLDRGDLGGFVLLRRDGRLVGSGALEVYGPLALIRSVAVDATERGNGLGRRIVEHLEARAASERLTSLYLLTTTAEAFFHRLGYRIMSRDEAPPAIRETTQFSSLCPDTAAFMGKDLLRDRGS
ncbi:MAG: arsenic resistance N-acetyltransferase ArsN2 [Gemmatimonadota bacterium]|nr:arsenic resistance N-acetyltransferase ArsN2 [Gemmatimonadota bacterium]